MEKLKIYLISQEVNGGYDTYSDAVVIAENEEEAKRIHPADYRNVYYDEEKKQFWNVRSDGESYLVEGAYGSWTNDLTQIKVEYLGEAKEGSTKGVVSASFHAG